VPEVKRLGAMRICMPTARPSTHSAMETYMVLKVNAGGLHRTCQDLCTLVTLSPRWSIVPAESAVSRPSRCASPDTSATARGWQLSRGRGEAGHVVSTPPAQPRASPSHGQPVPASHAPLPHPAPPRQPPANLSPPHKNDAPRPATHPNWALDDVGTVLDHTYSTPLVCA